MAKPSNIKVYVPQNSMTGSCFHFCEPPIFSTSFFHLMRWQRVKTQIVICMEPLEISVHELRDWMATGASPQLVDVREMAEYQAGHIHEALHIPLEQLSSQHEKILRHKPVVVYCHHGTDSALATEYLMKTHGFRNLHVLRDGMHAWATKIDQALSWY